MLSRRRADSGRQAATAAPGSQVGLPRNTGRRACGVNATKENPRAASGGFVGRRSRHRRKSSSLVELWANFSLPLSYRFRDARWCDFTRGF